MSSILSELLTRLLLLLHINMVPRGAVNILLSRSFALKDTADWTDMSVVVVSPLPVILLPLLFFFLIVKHCPCLSVIHVHILIHTGARARVQILYCSFCVVFRLFVLLF